jgi:hypothetical protein
MSEAKIQNEILAAIGSRPDCRLFRNHVGRVQDQYARWHTFGLCVGSADLIGWRAVTVTPEHVGQTLAVFLSIEVKTDKGKPSTEQLRWQKVVKQHGGIAMIARSAAEAEARL